MATIFKNLSSDNITSTRTLLHESVPVTGTIVSGSAYDDSNIKNYSHGMFQSVYDYPILSSSANHLFDLTCGYATGSHLNVSTNSENSKKVNIYGQMAQVLVGHDSSGNILEFDNDGNFATTGDKITEAYFINLSRLLTKDEIKKGTFSLEIGDGTAYDTPFSSTEIISDAGADTNYRTNSPAGEYGVLYTGSAPFTEGTGVGLIYYQAGVAVLTASVFGSAIMNTADDEVEAALTGTTIQDNADDLRHRYENMSFNNTIELNSTIYFCNANHNEFNYSSNPTYLSSSQIRVKDGNAQKSPSSYITSVGLYSADNELLATAKLSEPLKKDPSSTLTLRVRLDY
tara:strand:+ start:19348 stop:20376 length:1029 start_codon:yes stop_codon:yes gene_type:complete